ncbi:MAG: hypothetical protein MZW92_00205 [Comamonadaceae bacterium]|nr:hypothetical protein [Comamonadaceae bacterium]
MVLPPGERRRRELKARRRACVAASPDRRADVRLARRRCDRVRAGARICGACSGRGRGAEGRQVGGERVLAAMKAGALLERWRLRLRPRAGRARAAAAPGRGRRAARRGGGAAARAAGASRSSQDELLVGRPALQSPPYSEALGARGWAVLAIDHWGFGGQRVHRAERALVKRLLWQGWHAVGLAGCTTRWPPSTGCARSPAWPRRCRW